GPGQVHPSRLRLLDAEARHCRRQNSIAGARERPLREGRRCAAVDVKFGEYPKVGSFDGVEGFRSHLAALRIDMPCDDIVESGSVSPLSAPIEVAGLRIGGRFAINPMEGWDGERDGTPSPNTVRRWRRFGLSGAKLIWGGEAVAV